MNTVLALAGIVIKELYRRKDFYVLFVLTVVIAGVAAFANFFNLPNIVRDVKEICLLLISISGLVIALTMAARQIPAERESRTIFPLLAKPVTRGQVIAGKFLGCWLAVGISLFVFYFGFAILLGARYGSWPVLNLFQAFWFQWVLLGMVIALVLFGSVVFTSPAENITICFILVVGILFLGGHLNQVALRMAQPAQTIAYTVYFFIPHLEWFDIRDLVVYDQPLISLLDCVLATLYAGIYVAFFLFAAWLVFRRKALTV